MGGLDNDTQPGGGGSWRELGPQRRIRGQMNNEEVETPRTGAHAHLAVARALAKRGLVAFLAFAMAFGTTPAQLWADGAAGIAEAVTEAAAGSSDDGAAGEDTVADAKAADNQASGQADSSAEGQDAAASEASEKASAANQSSAAAAASTQASVDNQAVAVQSDASVTLSSNAKVYIQSKKDEDNSYSSSFKSGALKQGETLWANMYDEDPDDYWSSESSVANPGTWTYTWLASSEKGGSASDYTEVVGNEQSLTVTDALAGKYLICKVTAGGKDYYGPASSYGSGLNSNYIPGPVLAAGQANLNKVTLSNSSPSVGDTITATPYTDYSTIASADVNVTYSWYYGEGSNPYSATWTQIEGQNGSSLTLTKDLQGKYIKVVAGAGVNEKEAATSDKVMAEGAIKLVGVELSATSTEVGATLTAKAYTGSSYSPSYVDSSKVTFTWKKYKGTSSPSYNTKWETIEGQTGDTLNVTNDLEGYYISVSANAGANDVELNYSDAKGPFKVAGAVEISAVSIVNPADNTSVFTVGDTAKARAREKGTATGVYIDASKLNFQWLSSDTKKGNYAPIDGATGETLELTDALEGKYIKCKVTAKVGSSEATNSTGSLVAKAGSINVTKVALDASGKAEAGKPLTATATAASGDVTSSDKVTWSWYYGDSSSACDTRIDGVSSNVFTPSAKLYAGKYIQARANGGFGDVKSSAVSVVEPGAVELYGVTVGGTASDGSVHVGNVLTAKATKGNSYTSVGTTDTVHYQWQYADTKSTSDAAFKNIDGAADSATYTVSSSLVGKYIRVIATSENSVKSTQKKGYYGTTSVDPVGPVTLAGQYTLKSVEPAEASSATLNVGTTLTPKVKIPDPDYSWSSKDVPSDAKLTYTWYAKGADDADWVAVTDGVDAASGALTITDALVGKSLKLEASALDNTVTWTSASSVLPAGEYDLLRVVTTPQLQSTSTNLVAGDSVSADAYAKRVDGSSTNGVKLSADNVDISWYVADASDAADDAWTKLDVTGSSIQVPDAAANKYLKVVAKSGSSKVEVVSANKVIKAGSLEAAVQKLNDKNALISVAYSADGGNINDVLKAQLKQLGFDGIDVKTKTVNFGSTYEGAEVGISSADDKTNGDVTFFYLDPNAYNGYSIDQLRRASVTFELSRDGESVDYKPAKTVEVAWNEDKLQDLLDEAAEQLVIGYATGDTAKSVTQNLTLPYRAGANKKFSVAWTSSDKDALSVPDSSWSDYTGKVTRKSTDREVTLTAKVSVLRNVSDVEVTGGATHAVTVKGDPDKVAADKAELQKKVDAAFTYDNVKDFVTGETANKDGLAGDLQMPLPKTVGVDGKYYSVEYSASTDDVTFNGYKGTVYQPLPGESAANTKITITVTDKSNSEVTASKTLDYVIAPQDQDDLDNEIWSMKLAVATFKQAILDGQDGSAVTGNLHAPQKGYPANILTMSWCYTAEEACGHLGIVPVELPGASESTYFKFKSSRPNVISNEALVLTQPEYNTDVTISARLSSEKYARYAKRYPDNETYAQLASQDVSATVTVKGSTGLDDPNAGKTKTVTAKVTGISKKDADGNYSAETVVPLSEVTVSADEDRSAEDIFEELLNKAGCTDIEKNASGLTSLTLPDGRVLDSDFSAPYRYWSFFVNNDYASVGATQYYVKDGDCIEFRYCDGSGTEKPSDDPVVNPDTEHPEQVVDWNGFANGGKGSLTDALTPTSKTTNPSWAAQLLSDEDTAAGKTLSASDPLIVGGKLYLVTGTSFYDPNNGWAQTKGIAHLLRIDPSSGAIESDVTLGSTMDSTCRPIYSDGIIVIPLAGGYVQAVSAATLDTLWFSDAFAMQSLSSLTIDNGYVYLATADKWGEKQQANSAVKGTVKRLNLYTGAEAGSITSDDGGYYWTGGLMVGDYYVIADDLGNIKTFTKDLSKLVSKKNISSSAIRSSLVESDGFVYAVSRDDGTLHKLAIGSDGSIDEMSRLQFAGYSTSTPTILNGYAYIGGATVKESTAKGLLSVVDLSGSMSLVKKIENADDSAIMAESKSTPLVSSFGGDTYVYFTCNGAQGSYPYFTSGGGIYMYKLGDDQAHEVFVPGSGYAQYCMASVIADANGNLYYTNDSGHLFCVKSQSVKVTLSTGQVVVCALGSKLSKPADPTREGYTFGGWFTDAACTQAYDFDSPVTAALTLYAKWVKKPVDNGGNSGSGNGGNNGSGSGNGGSATNGSGNGTQGAQTGGSVAPGASPVAKTGTTAEASAKTSSDDKSSKTSNAKSGKSKKGSKSSKGTSSGAVATAKSVDGEELSSVNPLAIAGIAAGVIGLALILVFLFARRRKEDEDAR